MNSYTPPFAITPRIVNLVAEIASRLGAVEPLLGTPSALRLRRINRIKTIFGSLAIEGNSLSEEQITAILEGKRVLAPVREIVEVKNALAAYDAIETLNPFSVDDLLKAHGIMMATLIEDPGQFRRGNVAVWAGTEVVHMGPPADRVSGLIYELFDWLKKSKDNPLIKTSVFHYEFEFIHPFPDGNGRMGRFWQSLLLGKYHPVFKNIPIENMIFARQQDYYNAINESTTCGNSTPFIEFLLERILATVEDYLANTAGSSIGINIGSNIGINSVQKEILTFISENKYITAKQLAEYIGIAKRNIENNLAHLKKIGCLRRIGARKNGHWKIILPK